MPEQDIYKLVEEINKKKHISEDKKIDDIYNLLDEVKKENESAENKPNLKFDTVEETKKENISNLGDLKTNLKPIIRPKFPEMIMPYNTRSECFVNILQAIEYGDNNPDYKEGHEDALEKYYTLAKSNRKDIYIVEGQVKEEIAKYKKMDKSNNYDKGYYDGLEFAQEAINRSRYLIAKKINDELLKELG